MLLGGGPALRYKPPLCMALSDDIAGEWEMFVGTFLNEKNGTSYTWGWGSKNHSIEGKLDSQRTINNKYFLIF